MPMCLAGPIGMAGPIGGPHGLSGLWNLTSGRLHCFVWYWPVWFFGTYATNTCPKPIGFCTIPGTIAPEVRISVGVKCDHDVTLNWLPSSTHSTAVPHLSSDNRSYSRKFHIEKKEQIWDWSLYTVMCLLPVGTHCQNVKSVLLSLPQWEIQLASASYTHF